MEVLCVSGNVSVTEFEHVLEWEEALHLADIHTKHRAEREKLEVEAHGEEVKALFKSLASLHKAIGTLNSNIVKAFGK